MLPVINPAWLARYGPTLAALSAGIAVVGFAIKALRKVIKGWRWLRAFLARASQFIDAGNDFLKVRPVIMNIAAEFRNNGGSTLKDKMDEIHKLAQDGVDIAGEARTAAEKALAGVGELHESFLHIKNPVSKRGKA